MSRIDDAALDDLAATLGSRLGAAVRVERDGTLAVGDPKPFRMSLEARAGGLVALAPVYDAVGDLVSVLSGPVRSPSDTRGILDDLLAHYDACGSVDLPHYAVSRDIGAALAAFLTSERGEPVAVSVSRRPNAGFDVDEVRVQDEADMPVVLVAEHGAWVVSDGREGPARDHGSVACLVQDFAAEAPSRSPSPR